MQILQRYILTQFLRNLAMVLSLSSILFLIIDFFDRIDLMIADGAAISDILSYFILKLPSILHFTMPISVLVSSWLTLGLMSRYSEIVAMRASGLSLSWLTRPLIVAGLVISLFSLTLNETLIPYCARKASEVYNIDIRKKDQTGTYSKQDFWWRSKDSFFSSRAFDSRTKTLHNLSLFKINQDFQIAERYDARHVNWIDSNLGWSMRDVTRYRFENGKISDKKNSEQLPLPISESPKYFYDVEIDPDQMGYFALKRYMKKLGRDGIVLSNLRADLYSKLAFPFASAVVVLVVIPFGLVSARQGGLGKSFVWAISIAFSYFVINSFSVALGRAELLPAFFAAWLANLLMLGVGLILNWGAESP